MSTERVVKGGRSSGRTRNRVWRRRNREVRVVVENVACKGKRKLGRVYAVDVVADKERRGGRTSSSSTYIPGWAAVSHSGPRSGDRCGHEPGRVPACLIVTRGCDVGQGGCHAGALWLKVL